MIILIFQNSHVNLEAALMQNGYVISTMIVWIILMRVTLLAAQVGNNNYNNTLDLYSAFSSRTSKALYNR